MKQEKSISNLDATKVEEIYKRNLPHMNFKIHIKNFLPTIKKSIRWDAKKKVWREEDTGREIIYVTC